MFYTFSQMFGQTGSYSLPWLIELSSDTGELMGRYVNDMANVTVGGNVFSAAAFEYNPSPSVSGMDGGGTLSIATTDNTVIELIETYRKVKLNVVGVMSQAGTMWTVSSYAHSWGTVTWDRGKAIFTFERDDRLDMTFPGDILDHNNNRGN